MKNTQHTSGESEKEVLCLVCHSSFIIRSPFVQSIKYCPFCNNPLQTGLTSAFPLTTGGSYTSTTTLVKGHIPEPEHIKFSIGQYQILKKIGSGGMGEVFLAYDTNCGRRIALKRIREDLVSHKQMHNRFLKEARITSQLTHPAIIPIYSIHDEEILAYYTMPFVKGKTLKEIFINAQVNEKKGVRGEHVEGAIPSLIRIFLSVCQAVAYAHSKNVLHRDIKPDNIIVGPYGEVLILDWGLAKLMDYSAVVNEETQEDIQEPHPLHELTNVGKVVGTVAYMAPERALGQQATFQTDIYSLGVILYQILTLHHPFRRGTLKQFRKGISKEVLYDPSQVAPYRDVPPLLSQVALKCLSHNVDERYQSVDELILHIENYIEGRSDWFQIAELKIDRKNDWEFQENILMAEHMAITRGTAISNWIILMISKQSFPENIKIESKIKIGKKGAGIGFLLSVPEKAERTHLINGYCLWLGSDLNQSTKLLRSTVEVLHAPEIYLERDKEYFIRVEKVDHNIHMYLNDVLQISYVSHQPLSGTHIGVLSYDADYELKDFFVCSGNQNIRVNCLAVPDAFLAHKDYQTALIEYRRIGYSFPGRAEGREGMFRAGIALLEEARSAKDEKLRISKFDEALDEFTKMHSTPAAPLEYLGKSLVYKALNDDEEEFKCFELAFRRYPNHPLLPVLQEQILYRMHESSRDDRTATYNFILLAVRYFPKIETNNPAKQLINSLIKHWEPLYFIEQQEETELFNKYQVIIPLAFWLAKPYTLLEIVDELLQMKELDIKQISNALCALIELGVTTEVENKITEIKSMSDWHENEKANLYIKMLELQLESQSDKFQHLKLDTTDAYYFSKIRAIYYLIETALRKKETKWVHDVCELHHKDQLHPEDEIKLCCYNIWAYFIEKNWLEAEHLFQNYTLEQLTQENSLLHFLYGCWLYVSEGKEIAQIHFSSVLEVTYPRTWSLFSHFTMSSEKDQQAWLKRAFLWEKRQLYRQQALFYHCIGETHLQIHYETLEKQSYLND